MKKLKVTNIGDYPLTRLGFTIEPGATLEIEVRNSSEYFAIVAPTAFKVEEVVEEKPKRTTKAKVAKNKKVEKDAKESE